MDRNFERALKLVLGHEGGYVNNPNDKGGPTNRGITLKTFRAFVKADGTIDDLKNVTEDQIKTVYYRQYWSSINANLLPSGVDYCLFDFGVNSGPNRATKMLQKVVGAKVDGRIGPATVKAIVDYGAIHAIEDLCSERLAFLKRLSSWKHFGRGWQKRVKQVEEQSIKWVDNPADIREIIPHQIDFEVKSGNNQATAATAVIGAAGSAGAALLQSDWKIVAAIAITVVVCGIVGLVFKSRIIQAIEEYREAAKND